MDKKNVILTDCKPEEIATFAEGCNSVVKEPFSVITSISNWEHGGFLQNIRRYAAYFVFPFKVFLKRKHYGTIIGWQQFYAINFALFCRLFYVKKRNTVIAVNFTYKRKNGFVGKIYHAYLKLCKHTERRIACADRCVYLFAREHQSQIRCTAAKILSGFSSVTRVRPIPGARAYRHPVTGTRSPTICSRNGTRIQLERA